MLESVKQKVKDAESILEETPSRVETVLESDVDVVRPTTINMLLDSFTPESVKSPLAKTILRGVGVVTMVYTCYSLGSAVSSAFLANPRATAIVKTREAVRLVSG